MLHLLGFWYESKINHQVISYVSSIISREENAPLHHGGGQIGNLIIHHTFGTWTVNHDQQLELSTDEHIDEKDPLIT